MNKNLAKLIHLYPTLFWFYNRNYDEFIYLKNFALELCRKIKLHTLTEIELNELVELLSDYSKFIPEFKVEYEKVCFFLKVSLDVSKAIKKQSHIEENKDDDIFDDFGVSTGSSGFKP